MSEALYIGKVHHARFGAKRHRLAYRIFMVLSDVDAPVGGSWAWARNRPALLSLWDRDYGDRSGSPLRLQIESRIAGHGLAVPTGPMHMLTMPRVLGRAFNPLTVYYAHAQDGALSVVVYEVSNTFGDRHWYVLPAQAQRCAKAFFVSPFMDQDLAYQFDVAAPDETAFIGITVRRGEQVVLTASFNGHARPLTSANALAAWATHPLQTIGVLIGIYLEGAKLILKGLRWRSPHSAPSASDSVRAM